ncbi:MAG: hypothetical protein WAX77_02260, partial [Methylococcaceae bacterium]
MTELEIINHNEIDNSIIDQRVIYTIKSKKINNKNEQACFKIFGWVIDKNQRAINIVIVSNTTKSFHELTLSKQAIATRMSEKLGFAVNEYCGFSFKLETTEDVDLYLEIGRHLLPWKKLKLSTQASELITEQATAITIDSFIEANFLPAQTALIKASSTQKNTLSLGIEALFYYFSNQYKAITSEHIDSMQSFHKLIHENLNNFWQDTKRITVTEVINEAALKDLRGDLNLLLEECKHENFTIHLIEGVVAHNFSLASPFSSARAYCQESYEVNNYFTCLRFTDGQYCFFLIQGLSSTDAIYFPNENILISFAVLNEIHLRGLKIKLLADFAKVISYAQAENSFAGIIASHSRPYHFYYDIWPVLVELSHKPDIVQQLPSIIMRCDHDFNHATSLFDNDKCLILDSNAIDKQALTEHKWFIHVGTRFSLRDRFFYQSIDNALVTHAINNPSESALEKIKQLEGCYPIVWIGVEGQKRCWLEQVEGYAYILTQLLKKYPNLGVVFDGWTLALTPFPASIKEADKDKA